MCHWTQGLPTETYENLLNGLCSRIKVGERLEAWHHDSKRFVRGLVDESVDGWYEVRYALSDISTKSIPPDTGLQTVSVSATASSADDTAKADSEHVTPASDSTEKHTPQSSIVSPKTLSPGTDVSLTSPSSEATVSLTSPSSEATMSTTAPPPSPPPTNIQNATDTDPIDMSLYTTDTTTLSFGLARRPLITIKNLVDNVIGGGSTSNS